jgi:predicted transcriptional regulator of viral defense system
MAVKKVKIILSNYAYASTMANIRLDMRRRLFGLAAEQGGYFTAAQARAIGYSYQAQAHHVRAANWLRVDSGIFRLADWVPALHDDLARWSLWARDRGVVSHETALAVHGVGELESRLVHLTVPLRFSKTHPAVARHRGVLPDGDVQARSGFRVTTIVRSLIDVAVDADDAQLARVIQEALDAGMLTVRQLRGRAAQVDPLAALHIELALRALDAS